MSLRVPGSRRVRHPGVFTARPCSCRSRKPTGNTYRLVKEESDRADDTRLQGLFQGTAPATWLSTRWHIPDTAPALGIPLPCHGGPLKRCTWTTARDVLSAQHASPGLIADCRLGRGISLVGRASSFGLFLPANQRAYPEPAPVRDHEGMRGGIAASAQTARTGLRRRTRSTTTGRPSFHRPTAPAGGALRRAASPWGDVVQEPSSQRHHSYLAAGLRETRWVR
jgi:hypothetical protein